MTRNTATLTLAIALALAVPTVCAHGEAHSTSSATPAPAVETAFGRSAAASQATRTVKVSMSDTMRFSPRELQIERGEAVRFVVTNAGKTMHEMVLGTIGDLQRHAALMREHPGMEHDEPYMAHVAPGKTQTIVWQFTQPGEFHYGCLIPGHFEAGMIGRIVVR